MRANPDVTSGFARIAHPGLISTNRPGNPALIFHTNIQNKKLVLGHVQPHTYVLRSLDCTRDRTLSKVEGFDSTQDVILSLVEGLRFRLRSSSPPSLKLRRDFAEALAKASFVETSPKSNTLSV